MVYQMWTVFVVAYWYLQVGGWVEGVRAVLSFETAIKSSPAAAAAVSSRGYTAGPSATRGHSTKWTRMDRSLKLLDRLDREPVKSLPDFVYLLLSLHPFVGPRFKQYRVTVAVDGVSLFLHAKTEMTTGSQPAYTGHRRSHSCGDDSLPSHMHLPSNLPETLHFSTYIHLIPL